jgi:hypothetical protein
MKLVALALAENADAFGVVPLSDLKMIAWLTGYSLEELEMVLRSLFKAKVLLQMADQRARFAEENIKSMSPYWNQSPAENDPETQQTIQYQLKALCIHTDTAQELAKNYPAQDILEWIELYNNAVEVGLAQNSGWLVTALKRNWDRETVLQRIENRRHLTKIQSLADTLPPELKDLLQKMNWADVLDEVVDAYASDPDRVVAWAAYVVKQGQKAGRFRNALRSGLMPPREPVLRPPVCILENAESETADQEDTPEDVRILWEQCLLRISTMPETERGFSNGQMASWLASAHPASMHCTGQNSLFRLVSGNAIAANWIETHARGLIEDVLTELSGNSISLESVS